MQTFQSLKLTSATTPALTTSYAVRPVYDDGTTVMAVAAQAVGLTTRATFFVKCVDGGAGAFTGATVKVQSSYDGANPTDATAVNWIDMYTTNEATATAAIEHTLTPGAGVTAWAALSTTSTSCKPYVRVLGKATGANAGAGDTLDVWTVAS